MVLGGYLKPIVLEEEEVPAKRDSVVTEPSCGALAELREDTLLATLAGEVCFIRLVTLIRDEWRFLHSSSKEL